MSAKYIKLGEQGKWEALCLAEGTLRLGYYEVPHDMALAGDRDGIRTIYQTQGLAQGAATNHTRQVLDFYDDDPEVIWVTFSRGFLWWCHARKDVEFLGHDKEKHPHGSRLRRTVQDWSNRSLTGQELRQTDLSGRLTRVAGFHGTICDIKGEALDYLVRKINGQELPAVIGARGARQDLYESTKALVSALTWQDFELFVDILFSKSGWIRLSPTGKTLKDIDIELVLPVTGERALVQIKSRTSQAELDACATDLQAYGADRLFYVYHTPVHLLNSRCENLKLMNIDQLADSALRTGLIDWLIGKVG